MAKVALPIYGSKRIRHILKMAGCGFLLTVCVACSDNTRVDESSFGSSIRADVYAQYVGRARELALRQSEKTAAKPPQIQRNPAGMPAFLQNQVPFELWMFLAIVTDDTGNTYALQQRLVRLRIKDVEIHKQSDWDYSDVVAVDYSLQRLDGAASTTQRLAQRAALSLAGTDVQTTTVWVGAYAAKVQHTVATGSQGCQQQIMIDSPEIELSFHQTQCVDAELTKHLAITRSNALPVEGRYKFEGRSLNVQGHGWYVHAWGVPPDDTTTAVVFDRAWLLIENSVGIQAQRSRRRSGRGPKITTLRKTDLINQLPNENALVSNQSAEAVWNDTELDGAALIPSSWRFQETDHAIDVNLTPISPLEPQGGEAGVWFGAVVMEGSHSGYGFVSYGAQ